MQPTEDPMQEAAHRGSHAGCSFIVGKQNGQTLGMEAEWSERMLGLVSMRMECSTCVCLERLLVRNIQEEHVWSEVSHVVRQSMC